MGRSGLVLGSECPVEVADEKLVGGHDEDLE
jgi:hypothetical protein